MNSTPQMVSAAGETASLLSQFGPAIIILAIFLILFLAIVMYMVMQNKESQRVQNENLKLLLEAIINKNEADQQKVLEQQKEDSFDEKNLMDLYMKLNTKLKNECKDAMETLGSDRTAIYTFHNGSQNTHGLPFFKFSCICEYIAKGSGSRSKMKLHNSIPLNLLDDVMNTLNLTITGDLDEDYDTTIDRLDYEIYLASSDEEEEYYQALKDLVESDYNTAKENRISYSSSYSQTSMLNQYLALMGL